jgi:hypothetical protein
LLCPGHGCNGNERNERYEPALRFHSSPARAMQPNIPVTRTRSSLLKAH